MNGFTIGFANPLQSGVIHRLPSVQIPVAELVAERVRDRMEQPVRLRVIGRTVYTFPCGRARRFARASCGI